MEAAREGSRAEETTMSHQKGKDGMVSVVPSI